MAISGDRPALASTIKAAYQQFAGRHDDPDEDEMDPRITFFSGAAYVIAKLGRLADDRDAPPGSLLREFDKLHREVYRYMTSVVDSAEGED